jgi:carbonic anhydrase/acetyltransferase-like protein (isoleucine patch superfamily)
MEPPDHPHPPAARVSRTPGGWYAADNSTVTADVRIGRDASIWFGTVIRGDVAEVTIGPRTNVQDLSLIHCDSGFPNHIGADVTIGHRAIVHGVRVGDRALVGMGAILLAESVIGVEALVAAGAVVPPRMVVPARTLVAGVPAKIIRKLTDRDLEYMRSLPPHYVRLAQAHADGQITYGGSPLPEGIELPEPPGDGGDLLI